MSVLPVLRRFAFGQEDSNSGCGRDSIVVIAGVLHSLNKEDDKVVITFDGNGGTYDGLSKIYASVSEVMDPGFKNGDYVLIYWTTNADGTGDVYRTYDKVTATPGKPITLYAKWAYVMKTGEYYTAGPLDPVFNDIVCAIGGTGSQATYLSNNVQIPDTSPYIFVYSESGKWTWTLDESNNTYTAVNANGDTYVLSITLEGVTTVTYGIPVVEGAKVPVIWFESSGNVTYNISIVKHLGSP